MILQRRCCSPDGIVFRLLDCVAGGINCSSCGVAGQQQILFGCYMYLSTRHSLHCLFHLQLVQGKPGLWGCLRLYVILCLRSDI